VFEVSEQYHLKDIGAVMSHLDEAAKSMTRRSWRHEFPASSGNHCQQGKAISCPASFENIDRANDCFRLGVNFAECKWRIPFYRVGNYVFECRELDLSPSHA